MSQPTDDELLAAIDRNMRDEEALQEAFRQSNAANGVDENGNEVQR